MSLLALLACTSSNGDTAACVEAQLYRDLDGDGFGDDASWAIACPDEGWVLEGGDCDDQDATASPDGQAGCDCLDLPVPSTWYGDADQDGVGDSQDAVEQCAAPEGYVALSGDCAPEDPAISPLADEVWYDGVDQDCDGQSDFDADQDGHDAELHGGTDCDDTSAEVHPDAAEVCDADAVDEDCDGLANEDDPDAQDWRTWYQDADGDGHGTDAAEVLACSPPDGFAADSDDCDDDAPSVNPSAPEVCGNGVDDDCSDQALQCGAEGFVDLVGETAWAASGLSSALGIGDLGSGPVIAAASSDGTLHLRGTDEVVTQLGSTAEGWERPSEVLLQDLDQDGQDDLLVGAEDDLDASYIGGVFVHWGPVGDVDLSSEADVVLRGRLADYGGFGGELSSGDLTGDGVPELLVVSPYSSHLASAGGEVSVFELAEGDADAYDAVVTLQGDTYDQLATATVGDLDGDGLDDLVVGSGQSYRFGSAAGAVFVSTEPTDGMLAEDMDILGTPTGGLTFGEQVGLMDLDGDGLDELIATASGYGGSSGGLFVLTGAPGDPTELALATLTGPAGSRFGTSLWVGQDQDHDGEPDLLVSAQSDDSDRSNAGAVWIVHGPLSGVSGVNEVATARVTGPSNNAYLDVIHGGQDLTGDGADDVILYSWSLGVYVLPSGPGI